LAKQAAWRRISFSVSSLRLVRRSLGRDVEVGRDLVDRQVTTTGDGDDVALELRR